MKTILIEKNAATYDNILRTMSISVACLSLNIWPKIMGMIWAAVFLVLILRFAKSKDHFDIKKKKHRTMYILSRAVARLTNHTLLSRAVARLSNHTLLSRAVARLSNHTLLSRAVARLSNHTLLSRAVATLSNHTLLSRAVARLSNHWRCPWWVKPWTRIFVLRDPEYWVPPTPPPTCSCSSEAVDGVSLEMNYIIILLIQGLIRNFKETFFYRRPSMFFPHFCTWTSGEETTTIETRDHAYSCIWHD